MIIDLNLYKNSYPSIVNVCLNNKNVPHEQLISLISVATYVPVIVCCYYYSKYLGYMPKEIKSRIDNIEKFYNYTEIKGKEDFLFEIK